MALVVTLGLAPAALAHWSAPARPAGCSAALAAAAPLVVFPSAEPTIRSGPGALLWSAPRGCVVGAMAGEAVGAALAGEDLPSRGRALTAGAGRLAEIAAAAGAATGQVLAVGGGDLAEGKSVGAFGAATPLGGPNGAATPLGGPAVPVAVSSSYLGDVVIASPVHTRAGWAIALRVQRHYSEAPAPVRLIPVGTSEVAAVAATMDYRAELLLAWVSDGAVYAREVSPSGVPQSAQRLASLQAGSSVSELRALLSDDGHAIVAWRSQSAAPGGARTTTIALSISGSALAFGAPQPLESYRDPGGFVPPVGALRLLRLSSEAVMVVWTGVGGGHYVVRASPVSLRRGAWAPVTISGQGGSRAGAGGVQVGFKPARTSDAVLADLVAGPDAEAYALWRVAPLLANGAPGRAGSGPWAIRAARGHYAGQGEVSFGAPETVAPAGSNGPPAGAVDPATGRVLAAWVALVGTPHIEYALHTPTLPTSPRAPLQVGAIPAAALACCLGLPYASIDNSAIRIGTPLAACLK